MEVRIQNGVICGITEHGCAAFKGIPFAKPPVKELRFRPPVPCDNWTGTRDCGNYGSRPIQTPPPWCEDRDSAAYSEDCLYLNVWTPAADGKKRPVLFNIFGGGHMEGSASELGSEGYRIVKEHDVVFVAPNYRVGALGYLYLGHLLGESYAASGNLGLLDQILALQWVRDNIAFFGGDPDQVTIVGQSAGGKSVMSLLLAEEAKGLFHRAVAMSGALQSIKSIDTEKKLTENFLKAMRLTEADAKKLLSCDAEEIRQAQEKANEVYFKAESYGATADGAILPFDISQAVAEGRFNKVPLIMGHTLQELWPSPGSPQSNPPDAEIQKKLRWKFGCNWEIPYAYYLECLQSMPPDIAYAESATRYTYVDAYLKCADLFGTRGTPLWLYRWDYTGGLTACHSSDNEALFLRSNPEKHRLFPEETAHMDRWFREAVLSFVKTGNPNTDDLPYWPSYEPDKKERMLFAIPPGTESITSRHDPDFPLQVFR